MKVPPSVPTLCASRLATCTACAPKAPASTELRMDALTWLCSSCRHCYSAQKASHSNKKLIQTFGPFFSSLTLCPGGVAPL